MNPDRMVRLAISAVNQSEKLANCTPASMLGAFLAAAKMGLEPNTPLGHAWLVPYSGKATLVPGYKGYVHLAWQSGRVTNISTHIVYAKETFVHEAGTAEFIKHIPEHDKEKRGDPIGAYAIIHVKNSDKPLVRYMPQHEIESHRPPHWQSTPWNPEGKNGSVNNMLEMWKKTPLKAAMKLSPLSKELGYAIASDEAAERGAVWEKVGNDIQLVEDADGVFQEEAKSPPAGKQSAKKKVKGASEKQEESAPPPQQTEEQTSFADEPDQQVQE